jgi:hypothetical protein
VGREREDPGGLERVEKIPGTDGKGKSLKKTVWKDCLGEQMFNAKCAAVLSLRSCS